MVCKLGFLGMGTVGAGAANILLDPKDRHPLLREVRIEAVGVRSPGKLRAVNLPTELFTTDLESVVTRPDLDAVVEVMGGIQPAKDLVLRAIAAGKHVITANKALLARHGREIFTAAEAKGVRVLLEAAVCGGIPVIQTLKQGLGGNRLTTVMGIVNGTTNYILTRMAEGGLGFEEALAEAQDLGYAEADPTTDVDGHDAADKIAILASLAFGARIDIQQVHREGIRAVTALDMECAARLGYTVKLLAIAQRVGERVAVQVHPTLVPLSHPLATVAGVTNAVLVEGEPIGRLFFSGPGAGAGATASAVVGDILTVAAAVRESQGILTPLLGCFHEGYAQVRPLVESTSGFYVRFETIERPGTIGDIGVCFGHWGVALESVIQYRTDGQTAQYLVITRPTVEKSFQRAMAELRELPSVLGTPVVLRLLGDG
ncbi:MAG: homoserine dehydrogenase [Pseudanabaenaceae cyanobacterium]